MPVLHLLILSLIQGITEFLPISSSGHLVLMHEIMPSPEEFKNNELLIDVAVHVGTLFAVLLYFRRDVLALIRSAFGIFSPSADNKTGGTNMALLIIAGSVPVVVAGFILHLHYQEWLRAPVVVAWATVIFGILLYVSDKFFPNDRSFEELKISDAVWVGLAQVLALIPGTSRSGITMTAARFRGIKRADTARFSLLLGIVAISGAGVLGTFDVMAMQDTSFGFDVLIAAFLSFISGYIAIALMMKWLEKASFTPFVIYRLVLGIALLVLVYTGIL